MPVTLTLSLRSSIETDVEVPALLAVPNCIPTPLRTKADLLSCGAEPIISGTIGHTGVVWHVGVARSWGWVIHASSASRTSVSSLLGEGYLIMLDRLFRRDRGQGLVEYALIIALVAVVVIGTLILLGPQIATIFKNISNNL